MMSIQAYKEFNTEFKGSVSAQMGATDPYFFEDGKIIAEFVLTKGKTNIVIALEAVKKDVRLTPINGIQLNINPSIQSDDELEQILKNFILEGCSTKVNVYVVSKSGLLVNVDELEMYKNVRKFDFDEIGVDSYKTFYNMSESVFEVIYNMYKNTEIEEEEVEGVSIIAREENYNVYEIMETLKNTYKDYEMYVFTKNGDQFIQRNIRCELSCGKNESVIENYGNKKPIMSYSKYFNTAIKVKDDILKDGTLITTVTIGEPDGIHTVISVKGSTHRITKPLDKKHFIFNNSVVRKYYNYVEVVNLDTRDSFNVIKKLVDNHIIAGIYKDDCHHTADSIRYETYYHDNDKFESIKIDVGGKNIILNEHLIKRYSVNITQNSFDEEVNRIEIQLNTKYSLIFDTELNLLTHLLGGLL